MFTTTEGLLSSDYKTRQERSLTSLLLSVSTATKNEPTTIEAVRVGGRETIQQRCKTSLRHCNSTQVTLSAYLNRGMAYYELGYQQKAIRDLQQAAKHFSDQGKMAAYYQSLNRIKLIPQEDSVLG